MAWFKGTATDYRDFLDTLNELVQDDHISAISVVNGGTDYAVGDTITLAGGTKNHEPEVEVKSISSGDYVSGAAVNAGGSGYNVGDLIYPDAGTYSVTPELEVTSVSGGAVTGLQINNPGICSAQPSNPVATTTDGGGTGCTVDLSFTAGTGIITAVHLSDAGVYTSQASNPVSQNTSSGSGTGAKFEVSYTDTAWEVLQDYEAQEATAVAIDTAGTGYTVNDIVTVVGGSFVEAATVKITAVSGGVPTAVSVNSGGNYLSTPSNPASSSGGTGSGLTFTMTWDYQTEENKYLLIHNTTTDQYIGWRAFKSTSPETAYLLECTGFTGFNSTTTAWNSQPGSTGGYDTYTPLSGGVSPATIYYWLSVQDQRIVGAFKVGSTYPNMYLGSLDKFLTEGEYAYCQLVMGCIAQKRPYNYSGVDYGGMNNPGAWNYSSSYDGPGQLRSPDGTIMRVQNWYLYEGTPTYSSLYGVKISPSGGTTNSAPDSPNNWYQVSNQSYREMFTEAITIAEGQDALCRISDLFILVPCVVSQESSDRIFGNMIGVYAFNPDGVIDSEDRILIGSDVYRCFQNCNKSNRNFFFVIKED